MERYLSVWKRYFDFQGRAGRREFWTFTLVNLVIALILQAASRDPGDTSIAASIFYLVALLPTLGVTARRLHDSGRTGWWLLLSLIPLLGSIALLILCALRGQPDGNRYGPPTG